MQYRLAHMTTSQTAIQSLESMDAGCRKAARLSHCRGVGRLFGVRQRQHEAALLLAA